MSQTISATVSCMVEDEGHCSDECDWFVKPSVWDGCDNHYCCFSNTRCSKMQRSQACKAVFKLNIPAKRRSRKKEKADV